MKAMKAQARRTRKATIQTFSVFQFAKRVFGQISLCNLILAS